jgi:hypothetical protein
LKASSDENVAEKVYQVLMDPNLRWTIIQRGVEHSQQCTTSGIVEETLGVYYAALRDREWI